MNYITSCPECGTQFLLNLEHLQAYRGKVQCGQCQHVFNAKNRLTEVPDDITSAAEYQARLEHAEDTSADDQNEYVIAPAELQADTGARLGAEPGTELDTELSQEDLQNLYTGAATPATTEAIDLDAGVAPIVIEDLTTSPHFLDKPKKSSRWLSFFTLIFLVMACLQSVYFFRSQIAAHFPQVKPLLNQACVYAQCVVELPKNLDFLVIDDSDMQEDANYEGVIKFNSVLLNNANYVQAYPNIELTLTDANDKAALRRLVTPKEYLNGDTNVAAGMAAHQELRINLPIHASDVAVAGYRVLLTY